MNHEH